MDPESQKNRYLRLKHKAKQLRVEVELSAAITEGTDAFIAHVQREGNFNVGLRWMVSQILCYTSMEVFNELLPDVERPESFEPINDEDRFDFPALKTLWDNCYTTLRMDQIFWIVWTGGKQRIEPPKNWLAQPSSQRPSQPQAPGRSSTAQRPSQPQAPGGSSTAQRSSQPQTHAGGSSTAQSSFQPRSQAASEPFLSNATRAVKVEEAITKDLLGMTSQSSPDFIKGYESDFGSVRSFRYLLPRTLIYSKHIAPYIRQLQLLLGVRIITEWRPHAIVISINEDSQDIKLNQVARKVLAYENLYRAREYFTSYFRTIQESNKVPDLASFIHNLKVEDVLQRVNASKNTEQTLSRFDSQSAPAPPPAVSNDSPYWD
ncbi:hypothetical protein PFICI_12058 [Pestalotiopsis fici W106-1]|uniref:Uncharacterized protein n=1 Tax=Pestalotiopsis fici (strain W106-1 / CGMCC3.15140) TaxID=1229662 RepID=W3WUZ1_PESFW|nr:uncharacterized protein PFICI_12058 [Pestalotiopsis fici W106-1]ETS76671.1 hypothetical protein PFICI_12058 [Pestalotiopsis fici W106-1]